ncbi:MAG: 50S ribosomal protein L22 [Candidatus Woesearchaeota archaeon]
MKTAQNKTSETEAMTAEAAIKDASISPKKAEEICNLFRYKSTEFTKRYLERIIDMKAAMPFRRYTGGAGHKPGMGPGKYPVNAATQILKLVKAAEANAKQKGMGDELKIVHFSAKIASRPAKYGRRHGMKMKRAHVEIAVKELSASRLPAQPAAETKNQKAKEPSKTKKENNNKPKNNQKDNQS